MMKPKITPVSAALRISCIMKKFLFLLVLLFQLPAAFGGEESYFELPKEFYARQRYENSRGMSFEVKVYRLNDLVRIELTTEAAHGAYTILDVSKKLVHLVYPDKRQFFTLPYFGPPENKEFVDETFLYFQNRVNLTPVENDTYKNMYHIGVNGKNYEILLKDNGLPKIMTRRDKAGSSSLAWVDIVIQQIDPNLFKLPEGYTPARLEDQKK